MSDLTPQQREAVETEAKEVLVVAPAGSGKTRVLTHRVAHLIEHGEDPAGLMVLTFTRRAAGEMKERIKQLLPNSIDVDPLSIGTFHSVALSLLERYGHVLGYRQGEHISVYDEDDANLLLESVCEDLGYLEGTRWRLGLSGEKIRRYREAYGTQGGELVGGLEPETLRALRRLYQEYRHRLRQNNAVDYGLLMHDGLMVLMDETVKKELHARYRHVLVDEVQDTDAVQHKFLAQLAPPAAYFGVGDRRQAIYGFRGARPDLMVSTRPSIAIIDLVKNFRSGRVIVEAANRLIEHNHDPLARPMESATGREGMAVWARRDLRGVAREVSMLLDQGYGPGDIAVLARTHDWLRDLEPFIAELGVEYQRIGSRFGLHQTPEFRLLLASMRLASNPLDNVAFLRLRKCLRVDHTVYAGIRKRAAEHGESHWSAWAHAIRAEHQDGGFVACLPPLGQAIENSQKRDPLAPLVVDELVADLAAQHPGQEPWPTIKRYWSSCCRSMPLSAALRWHAFCDLQDEIDDKANAVTLATIHAAKGLEWPAVLMIGMAEREFPRHQAAEKPEEMLEERRCCYVGLTRAREVLGAVVPTSCCQGQQLVAATPSRFVIESGISRADGSDEPPVVDPGKKIADAKKEQ